MKSEQNKKYKKTKNGVLTIIYSNMKARNLEKFGLDLPFTSKEFKEKYIEDVGFLCAYDIWVKNNYTYYKKPSADRKNPDLPYTFDNIQFMTWEENRKKGEIERSRICTSVSMFDLNGKHIKDFYSIKQAVMETGLQQSGITYCCCGRYNQTGGYVFKYKNSGYKKTAKFIENNKFFDKESDNGD